MSGSSTPLSRSRAASAASDPSRSRAVSSASSIAAPATPATPTSKTPTVLIVAGAILFFASFVISCAGANQDFLSYGAAVGLGVGGVFGGIGFFIAGCVMRAKEEQKKIEEEKAKAKAAEPAADPKVKSKKAKPVDPLSSAAAGGSGIDPSLRGRARRGSSSARSSGPAAVGAGAAGAAAHASAGAVAPISGGGAAASAVVSPVSAPVPVPVPVAMPSPPVSGPVSSPMASAASAGVTATPYVPTAAASAADHVGPPAPPRGPAAPHRPRRAPASGGPSGPAKAKPKSGETAADKVKRNIKLKLEDMRKGDFDFQAERGYDSLMFPSNQSMDAFKLERADIIRLMDDADFRKDFKEGIELVSKGCWGWDLSKAPTSANVSGWDRNPQPQRLKHMLYSLYCLQLEEEGNELTQTQSRLKEYALAHNKKSGKNLLKPVRGESLLLA